MRLALSCRQKCMPTPTEAWARKLPAIWVAIGVRGQSRFVGVPRMELELAWFSIAGGCGVRIVSSSGRKDSS